MLFSNVFGSIFEALKLVAPNTKCIKEDDKLMLFRKHWDEYGLTDIVGFAPLTIENAHNWVDLESYFLESIEDELYGDNSNSIEPSLAFLYDPNIQNTLLEDIIKIERNEMYCRKYAIPLSDDLAEEIMRLPIASLTNSKIRGRLPKSARKSLYEMGITRDFADAILKRVNPDTVLSRVPKELHAESTRLGKSFDSDIYIYDESSMKKTRLKELEIQGFRAYGKPQVFDLDADLIVVAGPNGLGKTSFFDAIDFVTSGFVRRFDKRLNHLPNLRHGQDLKVTLKACVTNEVATQEIAISKDNLDINSVYVNGKPSNRKDVLTQLSQTTLNEGVDRLTQLFRASHLVNQSHAELTEQIHINSRVPINIMGRMLSLEDYVSGIKKTEDTIDHIDKKLRDLDKRFKVVVIEIEKKENSLEKLKAHIDPENRPGNNEDLTELLEYSSLRTKALQLNIIKVLDCFEKPTLESLKELRYNVELVESKEKAKTDNALEIVPLVESRGRLGKELMVIKGRIEDSNKSYEDLKANLVNKKNIKTDIDFTIRKLESHYLTLEKKEKNYSWFIQKKPKFSELQRNIEILFANLNSSKQNFFNAEKNCMLQSQKIDLLNKEIRALQETEVNVKQKYSKLVNLKESIPTYKTALEKVSYLKNEISKRNVDEKEYYQANSELEGILLELRISAVKQKKFISSQKERIDKFMYLVNEMKSFVNNNVCPLCNHQHQNKEKLLAQMDSGLGQDSEEIKELIKALKETTIQLETKEATLKENQIIIENIKSQLRLLSMDLNEQEELVARLNVMFAQEGFLDHESLSNAIENNIDNFFKKSVETNQFLDEKHLVLKQLDELQQESNRDKQIIAKKIQDFEISLFEAQEQLNLINETIFELKLDPDLTLEELNKELLNIKVEKNDIQSQVKHFNNQFSGLNESIRYAEKHLEKSEDSIKDYQNQYRNLETELNRILNKIENLSGQTQISSEEATKQLAWQRYYLKELSDFRNLVLHSEIIADSKERTANISILKDELSVLFSKKQEMQNEVEDLNQKRKILKTINSKLVNIQKESLEKYFDVIGPVATLIQHRLRPAYGFTNVKMRHADDQTIAVEVGSYVNKYLPPSDYFSESQMGIIALSLFFSVVFTQSWSGFKTILLDDPVQHFDDLNVYAFADLIRSWLASSAPEERPQIIISTCDDRLLRTLLKKFEVLSDQGRAKFYVFKTLSQDGPIVEALHKDKKIGLLS